MVSETQGVIGQSHEGIEIWSRSWDTYKHRLFFDDVQALSPFALLKRLSHQKNWKEFQYWHTPADTVFDPDANHTELVSRNTPLFGIREFFKPNTTLMDLGCGGGSAALGMARANRRTQILAVDYELGKEIPFPKHNEKNLQFRQEDWRHFTLGDNTVNAFLSDMGIGKYGNIDSAVAELTRIAKPGAIFRGTRSRGVIGVPDIEDRMASLGWNVWHLRGPSGKATNLILGQLVSK